MSAEPHYRDPNLLDVSAVPAPGYDESQAIPFRPAGAALVLFEEHTDRKPGRPSELTAYRVAAIVDALETGSTVDEAADAAGVGRRTLHRWREIGRKRSALDEYRQLWQLTEVARARYRRSLERVVHRGAVQDPKLALKVLERRFPDQWRLRITVEQDETPSAVQAREVLAAKLSQIERRLAGGGAPSVPESPAARAEREAAEDE